MGSRWTWRLLALPGVVWLSVFFLLAFYAVVAVAFGNQNTLSEPVPFWNPLDWNVGYMLATLENIWQGGPFLTVFVRTFVFVALALVALAPDRLPGGVLRGAARRPLEGARAPAPDPALLDQLPDADARVDQPALAGRARDEVPEHDRDRAAVHLRRPARGEGRLARGAAVHGDHGAHLRLPAVPDPAALRLARPDRPAPDRGGARSRREPRGRVLPRHAAALAARDPGRAWC